MPFFDGFSGWPTLGDAMNSRRVLMSTPYTQGLRIGGHDDAMCTCFAPVSRTMRMISCAVLPRTIESSTSSTRRPSISRRTGESLKRMPRRRFSLPGMMKVRPM